MSGAVTTLFQRRAARVGRNRAWVWPAADAALIAIAAITAALLIERYLGPRQWLVLGAIAAVQLAVFWRRGLYREVLRFVSVDALVTVVGGIAAGVFVAVVGTYFLSWENTGALGRVFLALFACLDAALCGGARIAFRLVQERRPLADARRAVIYGAGSVGDGVLRDLRNRADLLAVAFIDDDASRHGASIRGCRVIGGFEHLERLHGERPVALLIIADQRLDPRRMRAVFSRCMELGIQVKVVRGGALDARSGMQLQDIALEDLLRRPARNLDRAPVQAMLAGRAVLVTGAGGSIGSELCRQVAEAGAARLLLLDHSEFNLYQVDQALRGFADRVEIIPILANLLDRPHVEHIISTNRPDIVLHAAAYKHVPMVEGNPFLGMSNNLGGFRNLLDACVAAQVSRLVCISTDKAVRPTNVMGASKRACEVLLQSVDTGATTLCAVRFGNVLGSSGSVVPHFLEQIRRGGPVTVTHPDVTRFFMLLPEAVELVLQAGAMARHGEIFILDMGEPVKIVNLARQLIFLTGHVPDRDIRIAFTGMRPGEKLYEELLLDDKESGTAIDGILVARPTRRDRREVGELADRLLAACDRRDLDGFYHYTRQLVPDWKPSTEFNAFISGRTDVYPSSTNRRAVRTPRPEE